MGIHFFNSKMMPFHLAGFGMQVPSILETGSHVAVGSKYSCQWPFKTRKDWPGSFSLCRAVAGCIRMMTSKLSACLIHSLCSSDIKGQERKSNKQTTYCCHIIRFWWMVLVHVHLFNHGDPKRWCYQVHHLQLWSTEVKTLLKVAQRVKQSLLSLCLLNSRAHELPWLHPSSPR